MPYLEWVLNRPDADRGHTQYNRLFAEMEYVAELHAVLAWDKHSKALGFLAADVAPEGFLTSRIDFIGRARSLWTPRALETLAFRRPRTRRAHPTFDPIGSLLVGVDACGRGEHGAGAAPDGLRRGQGGRRSTLIGRHLGSPAAAATVVARNGSEAPCIAIGHGEIPPGTPQPYCEFADDGRTLLVRTPFTPRPFDHTMSNALGHVTVGDQPRAAHDSSGNSQQNRLTPDWPDTVTREVPGEAFYLYDPDSGEWYSPTYQPLNDADAKLRGRVRRRRHGHVSA